MIQFLQNIVLFPTGKLLFVCLFNCRCQVWWILCWPV